MKFLARSDTRIERLRGEHIAVLDQGRYLLGAALDAWRPETLAERHPFEDQLVDINAELARRWGIVGTTATQALPQRGSQDFDGLSDQELEHELDGLTVSNALSVRGSAAYVVAVNRIRAIDGELARRAEERGE